MHPADKPIYNAISKYDRLFKKYSLGAAKGLKAKIWLNDPANSRLFDICDDEQCLLLSDSLHGEGTVLQDVVEED